MTDRKLLLVHGSCHGGWCWDLLRPALAEGGIEARALDLPGHGDDRTAPAEVTLDGYARAILRAVEEMGPGPVSLLGHSAGGYAIAAAANIAPQLIGKLIFLCAYLPVDGQSLSQMRAAWPEQPLVPHIRRSADGHAFAFDSEQVRGLFYHDVPEAVAAWAEARLCPQPMTPQVTPIEIGGVFRSCEMHYIVCAGDRAIPPAYQRVMSAGLPQERVSELDASHSPFLSMPGPLADRIATILRG
jgi:pimeloyl-ACP methyl ester carboxylesterase